MSDNVIKFPNRELEIEFTDEELAEHEQIVESVQVMLEMHVAGIVSTSDVGWEHIMEAALTLGISAGLRAGMSAEELQQGLSSCEIREEIYDA